MFKGGKEWVNKVKCNWDVIGGGWFRTGWFEGCVHGLCGIELWKGVQKRNYPVAFLRSSYMNRGPGYTQYAVQMRCVRDDFYVKTFTLHYIADGNIYLRK